MIEFTAYFVQQRCLVYKLMTSKNCDPGLERVHDIITNLLLNQIQFAPGKYKSLKAILVCGTPEYHFSFAQLVHSTWQRVSP